MLLLWSFMLAAPPSSGAAPPVTDLALGEGHGCAITAEATAVCWGRNDRGQLGDGAGADSLAPVPVRELTELLSLSAGDQHTCALRRDRSVWCWGDAQSGQVGPSSFGYQGVPQRIALGPARSISAGGFHTCAALLDGTVACWGENLHQQLGTDAVPSSPFPIPVPGISGAVAVSAGYAHTCAALPADPPGSGPDFISCWGDDRLGQLGRPDPGDGRPLGPGPAAAALTGVRAISSRQNQTCALDRDGITCWGPAPDDRVARPDPVKVVTADDLVTLSLGWGHGCALTRGGRVTCWGEGRLGQTGARAPRPLVPGAYGLVDAIAIAAGREESCAVRRQGTVACWGQPTPDETRIARIERPAPPEAPTSRIIRQYPPGTALLVSADEVLTGSGARVRFTVQQVDNSPCANTRLATEVELKGKQVRLSLGDPILPGGDCIASPGPATTTYELPADTLGRVDLVLRWRKREDFFQVFIRTDRVEIIPLQTTFAYWVGEADLWRVPAGALAITCTDWLDSPVCVRRAADGLPTCRDVLNDPEVEAAPQLPDRRWASPWFATDPDATYISPDFDLPAWQKRVQDGWHDGSGCMELDVRTWRGETWTNHPPR